jgi:hypothetical protein
MTNLLLENAKLVMLFLLIGSLIGLSHLGALKARQARPKGHHGYRRPASGRL